MQTPAESILCHPMENFKDLLSHGKEALEMVFNNPTEYSQIVNEYGIFTIRDDDDLLKDYQNGKKGIEYHRKLCRLHDKGFLIIYSQIHFLMERDPSSERFIERFIDYISSSPTLDVCVRNSKDNDINNDIVPGTFYEQVALYEGLEDLALEFKVKAFSKNHDPENDPKVQKILENENPYYFSIGMRISREDYYQQDGETFNERINNFDLVRDIERYIKLAEDSSRDPALRCWEKLGKPVQRLAAGSGVKTDVYSNVLCCGALS
ncbi:hypothetical protein QL093DRAFT_2518893 [Fusarium oxysporum]|nr:hypothetical protein QL093DRAFT_2518893 [Fusarium oxysporum]